MQQAEPLSHIKSSACRPREDLADWGRMLPDVWKRADAVRAFRARGEMPGWPDWCFLPRACWFGVLMALGLKPEFMRPLLNGVAALGAWRATQGVFRFDSTLYSELTATPLSGPLPCEVFYRMPHWCVYIETPKSHIGTARLYGAYAYLDWCYDRNAADLCVVLDVQDTLVGVSIPLTCPSLKQALEDAFSKGVESLYGEIAAPYTSFGPTTEGDAQRAVATIVTLLVYICTQDADLGDGPHPSKPTVTHTRRHGDRLFAPPAPTTWQVGVRIGATLRHRWEVAKQKAANEATDDGDKPRARPRAHVRCAHFHSYWTGPRDSEHRQLVVRWIHPVLVNVDDVDELGTTVRPVKPANDDHH